MGMIVGCVGIHFWVWYEDFEWFWFISPKLKVLKRTRFPPQEAHTAKLWGPVSVQHNVCRTIFAKVIRSLFFWRQVEKDIHVNSNRQTEYGTRGLKTILTFLEPRTPKRCGHNDTSQVVVSAKICQGLDRTHRAYRPSHFGLCRGSRHGAILNLQLRGLRAVPVPVAHRIQNPNQ